MASENDDYEKDYTVRVAVRIRPLNSREIIDMCRTCTSVVPNEPQIILGLDKAFTFDYVYDTTSTQSEVFEGCVLNLVEGALRGFNATVLAYGQTGSGKTFTMGSGLDCELYDHQLGIIPRAVHHIFSQIEKNESHFSIAVQFIELYNEEIIDLLDPYNKKKNYKIQENEFGQISVAGAGIKAVCDSQEVLRCLQQGALSRSTASTQMNDQSSRSHAIFTILIKKQRFISTNSEFIRDDIETLTSKFHFVDLAGSERMKRTGATGERAREGISINCGLLALGNCISALGDKSKKATHVPYRDSKLTRLLQDSLGGNSQTVMIACISPSDRDFMETLNTLKYANRAKDIKNKVQINQDQNSRTISQLRKEVASLQLELLEIKQGKRSVDSEGNVFISDTFCEKEMLLSDNKRLQQRLKSMQETINVLNAKNAQLILEKEINKWSIDVDTEESVKNIVAEYLLEIEQLQAKLIESEEMYQQLKKQTDSSTFFGKELISNKVSDAETILKLAKEEVKKERQYVMARSFGGNENENSPACESNGSDEENVPDYDVRADLNDINCDIEIKTKLIEQLELSHQRMQLMKQNYEDKLMLLSSKIITTKRERDEVLANIGPTEKNKDEKINKIRDEYERKIITMRTEMKKLQHGQREHVRQQQEIINQEAKLRNLRVQLQELKTVKARLMKKMAEQSSKHKQEDNRKKLEIAKLQKEHRKQESNLRTLKAKMEAKDQILKRKTEEVTSLRRSQRSTQYKKVYFDPKNAIQSWNKLSKTLDRAAKNRHILVQFEQELERLMNERDTLSQTLTNLKNMNNCTSYELEVEEDSIQSNLNYVQESIRNIHDTIMEFEDSKDLEVSNDVNSQTIVNNIKCLDEAKYILQRMSAFVIKLTCNLIAAESRLYDHITLYQESQQENLIQRQLLQHFLAQNSSDKITDLFDSITATVSKSSNNDLIGSQRSLKSNETYDIPLLDDFVSSSEHAICASSNALINEISTKIRTRTAVQHSMLFGDQQP